MKYRAKWILSDSEKITENAFIEIRNGIIVDSGKSISSSPKDYVDLGDGVVIPSLVNCHTHLELCSIKGKTNTKDGFQNWVRSLINEREKLTETQIIDGIKEGVNQILDSGSIGVGDISSLFLSHDVLNRSDLIGVYFKEYLGNNSDFNGLDKEKNFYKSYAGHAPHSTSPDLLKALKKDTSLYGLPFSIHTAESDQESEFITRGKGSWADFLRERNIDFEDWPVPEKSSVQYLHKLDILDNRTILVHLLNADKDDFIRIKEKRTHICLCPRSNQILHNKTPDIEEIIKLDMDFCLGTDSLASCGSLSVFDEIKFISGNFSVNPDILLKSATINGARALGIDNFCGDLSMGKKGSFVYLDISEKDKKNISQSIVNGKFSTITTQF